MPKDSLVDLQTLERYHKLIKDNIYFKGKIDEMMAQYSDMDLIRIGAGLGATALQKHQDISGKADKSTTLEGYGITDAYTKAEIDSLISTVYTYKGSVERKEDLPAENNIGDVWEVMEEYTNYSWTGSEWTVLGAMVDISCKADKGTTLAEYGIKDAYTKMELEEIIDDNNPLIEDHKSYMIKGDIAFYHYKEVSFSMYLMERTSDGYHGMNPMGGSGIFIVNNTVEPVNVIIKAKNYGAFSRGYYKFGYADPDASASDINYALAGSGTTVSGSGSITGNEIVIPLIIPAGKKGFFINNGWTSHSETEGPIEVTECYTNDIFTVNDDFKGMTIKTEALVPTPMILTREEYDAIEPKENTRMYFIIED